MYATQQDLVERFGEQKLVQLTDRTNKPASTIDADVVDAALTDAAALVDGYLAKAYRLPLADAPGILTRVTADIAWYYLNASRADKDAAETRNFTIALKWLQDVSRGLVALEDGGVPSEQAGGGSVKASAPSRVFSRDSLRGL